MNLCGTFIRRHTVQQISVSRRSDATIRSSKLINDSFGFKSRYHPQPRSSKRIQPKEPHAQLKPQVMFSAGDCGDYRARMIGWSKVEATPYLYFGATDLSGGDCAHQR